jgi:hypothetical protein
MVDSIYLSIADMFARAVSTSWLYNCCCQGSCPRCVEFEKCTSVAVRRLHCGFILCQCVRLYPVHRRMLHCDRLAITVLRMQSRNNVESSSPLCITRNLLNSDGDSSVYVRE